jgi:hypothetical protein
MKRKIFSGGLAVFDVPHATHTPDLSLYAALVAMGDAARWSLGDQLAEDAVHYEKAADLYRAVSKVGESISTLRGCHWLSTHIPPVLRERYPLSRSQFRAILGWALLVEDMEEQLDRAEEMCEWVMAWSKATDDPDCRALATVQAIQVEVKRRKLEARIIQAEADHPEWVNRQSEMGARLRACDVLLNGEMTPGMVALARVLANKNPR